MHDPLTLIGERFGIQLWHRDPVEDACGWSKVKLTEDEVAAVMKVADEELDSLYEKVGGLDGRITYKSKVDTLAGVFWVLESVAWRVWRKTVKPRHIPRIMSLAFNPWDSFQGGIVRFGA